MFSPPAKAVCCLYEVLASWTKQCSWVCCWCYEGSEWVCSCVHVIITWHVQRLLINCVSTAGDSDGDKVYNQHVLTMFRCAVCHENCNLHRLSLFFVLSSLLRSVESGLKYKYCSRWSHVLSVLETFYTTAGPHCHKHMAKVCVTWQCCVRALCVCVVSSVTGWVEEHTTLPLCFWAGLCCWCCFQGYWTTVRNN